MSILDRIDEMLDREHKALIEHDYETFANIVHIKSKLLYELHVYWRSREARQETSEERDKARAVMSKIEKNLRLIAVQRDTIGSVVEITRNAYARMESDGTYSTR